MNHFTVAPRQYLNHKVKIPVMHLTYHITKPTITITRALHIAKSLQIILILLLDDDNLMRWKEQLLRAVNIYDAAGMCVDTKYTSIDSLPIHPKTNHTIDYHHHHCLYASTQPRATRYSSYFLSRSSWFLYSLVVPPPFDHALLFVSGVGGDYDRAGEGSGELYWFEHVKDHLKMKPPSAAAYCRCRKQARHQESPPLRSLSETAPNISTVVPKRYSRCSPNLFMFVLKNTAVATV
nr:hypothetical protein [Tanacetum cinerariifolium]